MSLVSPTRSELGLQPEETGSQKAECSVTSVPLFPNR